MPNNNKCTPEITMQSGNHLENLIKHTIPWNYLFYCGRPISMDFKTNPKNLRPNVAGMNFNIKAYRYLFSWQRYGITGTFMRSKCAFYFYTCSLKLQSQFW